MGTTAGRTPSLGESQQARENSEDQGAGRQHAEIIREQITTYWLEILASVGSIKPGGHPTRVFMLRFFAGCKNNQHELSDFMSTITLGNKTTRRTWVSESLC